MRTTGGFKRLSILMTALLLAVALLAGCASNGGNGGNGGNDGNVNATGQGNEGAANEAGAASDPAEPALEPVELKWIMLGNGQPKDTDRIEQLANEYLKDKINATIDFTVIDWGSWDAKTNAMFTTSEEFDLIFTASWKGYTLNSVKGAFWEISEEDFRKYAPKTRALFSDEFLAGAKVDGKLFGIPNNKDRARSYGFLYRKDVADELGIDMSQVKTFNDLTPILQQVKEKRPDLVPFGDALNPIHAGGIFDFLGGGTAMYLNGGDEELFIDSFSPEYLEAHRLMHQWFKAGYLRKDVATAKDKLTEMVNTGKVFTYAEQLKPGKSDEINAQAKGSGTLPEGAVYDQVVTVPSYVTTGDVMGAGFAISKTSKNPERALMFLELLNSDKYINNLFNFGEENVHYKKTGDNRIEPVPDAGYSMVGLNWMYGNQFLNYLLPGEPDDKWEQFDKFNNEATPSKALGFVFNEEPVKKEVSAVNAVNSEFGSIYWGVVDPEVYIPKYQEKLKAAGIERIHEEVKKQFEEWKATR